MADYARGRSEERPPALQFYQNVKAIGDPFGGGWMEWPQDLLTGYRMARNVYESMRGYVGAQNAAAWANANPEAWQIVGRVLALEMERDDGPPVESRYDVWLRWRYGVSGQ